MGHFLPWQKTAASLSLPALLVVCGAVRAQEAQPPPEPGKAATAAPAEPAAPAGQDVPYHWLDRTRDTLYDTMWHSAEHVDRWFGSAEDDAVYRQAQGRCPPALL